jgi:hypothetical protein
MEKSMPARMIPILMVFFLVSFDALADGISIDPGNWEMTATVKMPMLPQPRVTTTTECIRENEITPETLSADGMEAGCTFDAEIVGNNTMKWTMDCDQQGGHSSGEWEATSHGNTITGGGTITINMEGQAMVMTMNWDGKRIGDCP